MHSRLEGKRKRRRREKPTRRRQGQCDVLGIKAEKRRVAMAIFNHSASP